MEQSLRISEIFYSLQGEANTVGLPTVFIRLTGCPLRCSYCDTAYAFSGGEKQSFQQIIQQVQGYQTLFVTVTGGEPLVRRGILDLIDRLGAAVRDGSLEELTLTTNGRRLGPAAGPAAACRLQPSPQSIF